MSASFELLSHPDRTLKQHLNSCDTLSTKLLALKYISSDFFEKNRLDEWRNLLVYLHDFGKATDFFQARIIKVIEGLEDDTFYKKHSAYIGWFKENKYWLAMDALEDTEALGYHAELGAYALLQAYEYPDSAIKYVLFEIIKRHHGALKNFSFSELSVDDSKTTHLAVQLKNFNEELYNRILDDGDLPAIEVEKINEVVSKHGKLRKVEQTFMKPYDEAVKNNVDAGVKYFLLQHFLFSLLLSADKGDLMLRNGEDKLSLIQENRLFKLDLIDVYKNKIFNDKDTKPIDILREQAYQDIIRNAKEFAEKSFFSITLPTGMGKTFSAFNTAVTLQNNFAKNHGGVKPRIIYCLPFTSIIDQNAAIMEEIVAFYKQVNPDVEIGKVVKHHYLSDPTEGTVEEDLTSEKYILPSEAEYLVEGWEHEFIVTTFVQLLESIFTNQNRALRKFHNMANAIIILDEVQNVPPKYYEAIELVFSKMAEYFDTKFVFVTATQPILMSKNEVIELTDPALTQTKAYFEGMKRICIDQSILKTNDYKLRELEDLIPAFIDDVQNSTGKSFLFIFNTIAQSQLVYQELLKNFGGTHKLYYLSGSVLPLLRKQEIERIKNKEENEVQIVVSTQVVEAGVDIDFDVVYRDLAPLDSINQSAGRCNRNGRQAELGSVKLFNTGKHRFIYDTSLTDATRQLLSKSPAIIEERDLYALSNDYFKEVHQRKSDKSDASYELINNIKRLNLENVKEGFKLIEEKTYSYNVFVPFSKEAENLWNEYQSAFKIEDQFERKRFIKSLKSKLLQYVTRFPKKKYQPPANQAEQFIIYEPNWSQYYDLKFGFKLDANKDYTVFL